MLEGWEISEASKQKAVEFDRKCDWCGKGVITHIVVGSKQRSSMVCGHCYRKKNVKEVGEGTIVRKKPYRWAKWCEKKRRAVSKST
jgi:hypothetical protein